MLLLTLAACQHQPEWRRRAELLLHDPNFPRPADKGPRCLTDELLAQGIRAAVQSAAFAAVWDYGPLYGEGCPAEQTPVCLPLVGPIGAAHYPQIDISVIVPNRRGCAAPVAKATLLFDRTHPSGVMGKYDPKTLELTNIRFRKWDEARFNGGRWKLEGAGPAARAQIVPGSEVAWDAPYAADSLLNSGSIPKEGKDAIDFLSPWPASVFKLMVTTRFLKLLDQSQTADGQPLTLDTLIPLPTRELHSACPAEARTLTLRQALETMLQWSGNCAAAGLVRFLHTHGDILQSPKVDGQGFPIEAPLSNQLNATLAELGLSTLQMNRTSARAGRVGNPNDNYDGRTASVTNNHMTSWDAARLLWLFDELPEVAQPHWEVAPGRPVSTDFVSARQKALLRELLRDSYSGSGLANNRTCVLQPAGSGASASSSELAPAPGIPALLSGRWLDGGRLRFPFQDYPYPSVVDDIGPGSVNASYRLDLAPCQRLAEVEFLNKAGLTNVAASSAGIVRGLMQSGRRFKRHYIVSFFSSLGSRFGDEVAMKSAGLTRDANRTTHLGTTQAIPTLGANLDAWLALWAEDK